MFKKILSGIKFVLHKIALFWSIVILTIIYFVGMGLAFILILIARKRIIKSFKKTKESYWNDKDVIDITLESAKKS